MKELLDGVSLPGLGRLATIFRLSCFEIEVLRLCAAAEVSAAVGQACFERSGQLYPTLGLALELFEGEWAAFTPAAPLRRFRLVEVVEGPSLAMSRIRLHERVLHSALGNAYLEAPVEPVSPSELMPSHAAVAMEVAKAWRSTPTIVLVGSEIVGVASRAAGEARLSLYKIRASAFANDVRSFCELWNREALLLSAALLVLADAPEAAQELARIAKFPLAIASKDDLRISGTKSFDVRPPTAEERESIWRRELGERGAAMNGELKALSAQFCLGVDDVRAVAREADLWLGARSRARQALDGLAQRIESKVSWDDLVLPEVQTAMLRQIAAHVRSRAKVYHAWGFAERSDRGLGIGALFAGPSGTGKTLASEVLAGALGLDLYRIDLSAVVSKYIGETEKNLRRIFDAAEGAGAVLLFDEADALFGKRSEVRDSHDRYANLEVAYLLQRMEAYTGLVVLTTNLKGNLDPAFSRRLRFIVQFPFPDHDGRRRIWEGVFPKEMPRVELDYDRLAGLALSGGSIRNVALNAAFLAADEGASVEMRHLAQAAKGEFAKLERPVSEVAL